MKLDQAVRINDHLLDAGAAMEKARMAIAGLGKVERIELGDWLDAMIGVLEDKLLQPIYAARSMPGYSSLIARPTNSSQSGCRR
ncbi:hypothetical protein [Bradyrhizobium sp. Ghvi]|uniref:hypothetical protein n=1 Tax=Bradyrhizobium sp. Ghvi TaxID=1855319 RepID=UPI0011779F3F|nr:hypothetical protein [Bradyrhizobium sp. Ghvi]